MHAMIAPAAAGMRRVPGSSQEESMSALMRPLAVAVARVELFERLGSKRTPELKSSGVTMPIEGSRRSAITRMRGALQFCRAASGAA